MTASEQAARAADQAARSSYGRLLAYLASRTRDLSAAEDALADAFYSALQTWPVRGVPDKPEAWLLTAARNNLFGAARRAKIRAESSLDLQMAAAEARDVLDYSFPDERLKLLFICAHPAIDPAARAPLMLQTVLGLDAARIASAFLVSPTTMGQRLVRAKAKIAAAGIAFQVPELTELPDRLDAVLEAIYAAYGTAWEDVTGSDPRCQGLADEAIWLGRLLVQLLPNESEAHGLLALILHCEARRDARRDAAGAFVPLSEQDVRRWSNELIDEAERELAAAIALRKPVGHFQLEAAIQSAHASRAVTGEIPWPVIAFFYEGLARVSPTTGVLVGRAAALAEAFGPERGMAELEELEQDRFQTYQPYWALKAHLLRRLGRAGDAAQAYDLAIGLTEHAAVRDFLLQRRNEH